MGEEAGTLCCKCRLESIAGGANNKCGECLRSETIIPLGTRMNIFLRHCPECDSYLKPPTTWINAQSQSEELLSFCIKYMHLPPDVKIVNAKFIQLEPHYKTMNLRLSLSLTLEKEDVVNGGLVEQRFVVSFFPRETMCEPCARLQPNPDQWVASVQLRQHNNGPLRRTFFHLEQIILSHDAAVRAIKIKQTDQGIDFFFANPSQGEEFVEFIGRVVPVKKQPMSHDTHTNRYVFPVEIPPICRDDLICLPPKVAAKYGHIDSPIVLCINVNKQIALLNPLTLRNFYLEADEYHTGSFECLRTSRQLVEFVILDVINIISSSVHNIGGLKCALAEVRVARLSDVSTKNDEILMVRTHLGHSLKPGDKALGYDLSDCEIGGLNHPKVILIRKSSGNRRRRRGKHRPWKLKSLNMEVDDDVKEMRNTEEYEEYLVDLEENSGMRSQICCYHNKEYVVSEMADGEEIPCIPPEELLLDLDDISDMENDGG